jgi:hypothetical protein
MQVMRTERKGKHLNTLEKYHTYKISKEGLHMNHTYNETHNPISEMLHEKTPDNSTNTQYTNIEQPSTTTSST